MRELGSGTTYNTHNTTSLIRTLKYVLDILQTEEAFTVKEYTHTHTTPVKQKLSHNTETTNNTDLNTSVIKTSNVDRKVYYRKV